MFADVRHTIVFLALVGLVLTALPAEAAPTKPPRISPPSQVSQILGIAEVDISYGRPAVKERTIWGELVPYGQVWRTGANEATTITFSNDVKVEGKALAAGTYSLFTIPGKSEWTIIFNKQAQQWGAFRYQETEDALRVTAKPRAGSFQELFTISFPEVTAEQMTVELAWDKVAVPFTVTTASNADQQLALARKAIAADPENGALIWEWVGFCQGQEIRDPDVVAWAERLVAWQSSFYTVSLQAQVQAQNGHSADAAATAAKALELGEQELGKSPFLTRDAIDTFAAQAKSWRVAAK